jgi:hypothetical protein
MPNRLYFVFKHAHARRAPLFSSPPPHHHHRSRGRRLEHLGDLPADLLALARVPRRLRALLIHCFPQPLLPSPQHVERLRQRVALRLLAGDAGGAAGGGGARGGVARSVGFFSREGRRQGRREQKGGGAEDKGCKSKGAKEAQRAAACGRERQQNHDNTQLLRLGGQAAPHAQRLEVGELRLHVHLAAEQPELGVRGADDLVGELWLWILGGGVGGEEGVFAVEERAA